MAIFGPYGTVRRQIAADPRFAAAIDYVQRILDPGSAEAARLNALEVGKTERTDLPGGSFALDQVYQARARADGFYESHRKYIDVQVIVSGEELMEVEDIARLTVTQDYLPERDFMKYANAADPAVLRMKTGDVAIFFPEDGHMPSLHWRGDGLVRKTVVKVPVSPA